MEKLHTDVKERRSYSQYGSHKKDVVVNSLSALVTLTSEVVVKMVGQGRLELPTSRLSVVRSNQLSYKPN